jgi:hypothetical protein
MAFSATGWNTVAAGKAGNAPSIYTYKSADTQATINTAGYFNSLASILKVGDVIFIYDTTTPSMVISYVNANDGTTVDIADGTTVSATDTD